MGRRRVELKNIENKINRQVTFSKRRNGLFKKAHELSVLCDAEIALIVFSSRGKLYKFAGNNGSASKTLERYQHCCFTPHDNTLERETQSWYQELNKLKGKFESLQRTQRNLLGVDLGQLSVKELQNLEKQLEVALALTRQRKSWYQELNKLKGKFESLQRTQRNLLGVDLGPLSVKELQNLEKQLEVALALTRQRKTQIMLEHLEELTKKSWYQELNKLKGKFESLQCTQRNLLGAHLGPLSVKELQNLEKQLEVALALARQRKTQIMLEHLEELTKKERHLGDLNKHLKYKIEQKATILKRFKNYRIMRQPVDQASSFLCILLTKLIWIVIRARSYKWGTLHMFKLKKNTFIVLQNLFKLQFAKRR